jgi:reactive intermediate/imine deaminase
MSGNLIKLSRNTENAPRSCISTQTVAFSHYNHISAQLGVDPQSGKIVAGGVKAQTKQCLANIKAIVESVGHVMDDVVKINIFLKNILDIDAVDEVYATFFQSYLPARTTVAVAALPLDDALVQIDAIISNGESTLSPGSRRDPAYDSIPQARNFMREMAFHSQARNFMRDQMRTGEQVFFHQSACEQTGEVARNTENEPGKVARNTEHAPRGPASTQTVAFSHYNNISAQLPINPKSGKLVAGDVKKQAGQCLKNIKAILESIDVPFDDIVKVTIFLKNLSDIDAVNQVYTTFFPDSAIARVEGYFPARTVVAASGLPMHALVQIEAVVSHGDGTPPQAVEDRHGIVIEANNTENAPQSSLSTQTVAFSHYNHISAQLGIDPISGKIVPGGVKEQARQCLKNIEAILESIDHSMDDIVKINIALKNIADIGAVDDVYATFFKSDLPARTAVGVSSIPMDALVQIDAVVSNGEGTAPGFH